MRLIRIFTAPLIQRLSVQFLALGLLPIVVLTIIPILDLLAHGIEPVGETLLFIGLIQSGGFLVVVLVGALVTLRRLALPIQELVKGASAISAGDLSYRVPIRPADREMVALTHRFNAMAEAVESMHRDIEEQRAALQAALNEREREFNVILEIASLVNRPRDLTRSTQQALITARAILGTDLISLAMVDESGQITSTAYACRDCTEPVDCHDERTCRTLVSRALHSMGPNLIRQVIETRKPLRVWDTHSEDAGLEPHVLAALDALNMHKMYLRPLVSHERVLGLLILMRHAVQRVPGRSETLLETLAENFTILIENWQLQNQLRKLSIMEERHRLARELHDSVTQSLFILSLTARGLQSSLGAMANGNEQALNVLVEQTKAVQNEMRRLINELRPIDLEEDTFEDALRQHIQSVRYSTNTEVQFTLSGNVNAIPKPIQRNLNRIAQEALSNIARHAQAKHAAVRLEVGDEMVTLTIQDDGVGFDLPTVALQESNSLGLTSMRERAELLGGALLVRSQPGRETVITAQIPITQQLEEHVGI